MAAAVDKCIHLGRSPLLALQNLTGIRYNLNWYQEDHLDAKMPIWNRLSLLLYHRDVYLTDLNRFAVTKRHWQALYRQLVIYKFVFSSGCVLFLNCQMEPLMI